MKVMLTVLYLSLGVQALPSPSISCISIGPEEPSWTLEELERVLYSVSRSKGVAPTVILNRLLRKYKAKQRLDKIRSRNPLQQMALNELLSTVAQIPPLPKNGREGLLPPSRERPSSVRLGKPRIISPPEMPGEIPFPISTSSVKLQSSVRPAPLFIPVESFKPPPGVTIRVNTNGATAALPEVTVTISPMMTVVEALRQADSKFRSTLGIQYSGEEFMSLSFSPYAGCYVLSRFYDVIATERFVWKIMVTDSRGQVVYDSLCLPSRDEVPVKPGTTISLFYTSL